MHRKPQRSTLAILRLPYMAIPSKPTGLQPTATTASLAARASVSDKDAVTFRQSDSHILIELSHA